MGATAAKVITFKLISGLKKTATNLQSQAIWLNNINPAESKKKLSTQSVEQTDPAAEPRIASASTKQTQKWIKIKKSTRNSRTDFWRQSLRWRWRLSTERMNKLNHHTSFPSRTASRQTTRNRGGKSPRIYIASPVT